MTTSRSLPSRPSFESIRKQAKKLARAIEAGDAGAIARARAHLPHADLPLSQRDAQLVLAREYGFGGWQDLKEEVLKRMGHGLEWAGDQAQRAIHDNDIERLQRLLAEYPALRSWRDDSGASLLSTAVTSFGDSGDHFREERFTRPACAEFLIDAGAVVDPTLWQGVVGARARSMLQLLWEKGALPSTLPIFAARGDLDAVRACLDESVDLGALNEGFMCACRFGHSTVAAMLLDRCIALDADLGRRIDGWKDRAAFIDYQMEHPERYGRPWRTFVMNEVMGAIHHGDLLAFTRWLRSEPDLLGDSCVGLQVEMIERSILKDREPFIARLFELDPAVLRSRRPPNSPTLKYAFEYGKTHLVPLLTRIWPLPDDLPHAAGIGDFGRVRRWFDADGRPALGNVNDHYPANNPTKRGHLHWGAGNVQQVLNVALAWACINRHLDIAAFLLDHGADINTNWSTHEPASILHELVFHDNDEAMRFLIDRGIDLTIRDHRWNATAEGWAYNAAKNEEMARFLGEAEERRRER